jgi:hypothetical protein
VAPDEHQRGRREAHDVVEVTGDLALVAERAWRNDVALEIWVDTTTEVVTLRLEGLLDGATGAHLSDVVRACQFDGHRAFILDTGGLHIDPTGWAVIHHLREEIHAAGGRLHWDSTAHA